MNNETFGLAFGLWLIFMILMVPAIEIIKLIGSRKARYNRRIPGWKKWIRQNL